MPKLLKNVDFVLNDDGTISIVIGRNEHVNVLDSEFAGSILRGAVATDDTPGVVKPDSKNLSVDDDGVLALTGFAKQLVTLFASTTTGMAVVSSTATLNDLAPGIYLVKTSAARASLGIPKKVVPARPNSSIPPDTMVQPGGLLIKLGSVISGPVYAEAPTGPVSTTGPVPCAFFIEAYGYMYMAYCHNKTTFDNKGRPTITAPQWTWKSFMMDAHEDPNAINIQRIVYISADKTIAAGDTYAILATDVNTRTNPYGIALPYKSGYAYGPTAKYALTYSSAKGGLVISAPASTSLTLPAGKYMLSLK